MPEIKYDDLKFVMEKYLNWDAIAEAKQIDNQIDEYMMTLDTVATFCENQVVPKSEEIDNEECHLEKGPDGKNEVKIPAAMLELFEGLKELGLYCGPTLPEEYGGYNFPMTAFFALGELFSMADGSLGLTPMLQEGCGQVVAEYANEEIKKAYLPELISGESFGGMGLTEPGAGSDLAVMQTTARPVKEEEINDRIKELQKLGEVWIVNGSKIFITNGFGDVLTLARTGDSISMFLVYEEDKETARVEHKLGIKGSPTCEIFYEDSPGVLIGKIGGGLVPNMMKLMNIARLGVATQGIGIAQRAHLMATNYATNDRVQFGVNIIEHPPVRQIIFENEINLQATRGLVYLASYYFDLREAYKERARKAGPDSPEYKDLKANQKKFDRIADILIPLAKYDASELSNSVTYSSLQVYGGLGFTKEYPLERFYRDARITSIYEGASQIQIDQVFNESYVFEKLGLINQYKLGGGKSFVENEKNMPFTDIFLNEMKDEILSMSGGKAAINELLAGIDKMRQQLKQQRQLLFLEEKKRDRESSQKFNGMYQKDYVDTLGAIIKGYILTKMAALSDHKVPIARSYIVRGITLTEYCKNRIRSGNDDLVSETYYHVMGMN